MFRLYNYLSVPLFRIRWSPISVILHRHKSVVSVRKIRTIAFLQFNTAWQLVHDMYASAA